MTLNAGSGGASVRAKDRTGVETQIVALDLNPAGSETLMSGAMPASQSGTWNITNISGTVSLPTGAATAAKQPALGTAGTASADVLTVQGIASMTALKVDGSGVTQPVSDGGGSLTVDGTVAVSGTVTVDSELTTADLDTGAGTDTRAVVGVVVAASGGAANLSGDSGNKDGGTVRVVIATDQPQLTNALKVDGSAVTQPVSGTVTANAGSGTFTISGAVTQSGTWTVATNADGTSGSAAPSKGLLVQGSDGTNARNLSTTTGGALKVDLSGTAANSTAVKVDGSAVTQPVSDGGGSLTVDNGGTFAVQATVAAGATNIAKAEDDASANADVGVPAMAVRKATPANTSGTDGDYEMLQMSAGRLWVDASGVTLTVGSHAVTNAGTFATQAAQSGTWTVQPGNTANTTPWLVTDTPATSGGLSYTHITAAGSNNKTQVKGSAGQLYAIHAVNLTATAKYIKVFDKTSANVTAGTTSADYQFPIPANSTTGAGFVFNFDKGVAHANGITVMLTGGVSLTDNTALSANDVVATFFYH